jgi:hypothetical protein
VEDGGTYVIDYRVSYTQGIDYHVLAENVLPTSYTAIGLTADNVYKFKIEARNSFGFSAFSNIIEIRAARLPDAPINLQNDATITTHQSIGLNWQFGASDGGSPVLDYRVSFD